MSDLLLEKMKVQEALDKIAAAGNVTDRWEVFGGYSFNDAIVVSSPFATEVGHSPPNAPKHTVTMFTSYRLPWRNLELGGGINYVSARTASSSYIGNTSRVSPRTRKVPRLPDRSLRAYCTPTSRRSRASRSISCPT